MILLNKRNPWLPMPSSFTIMSSLTIFHHLILYRCSYLYYKNGIGKCQYATESFGRKKLKAAYYSSPWHKENLKTVKLKRNIRGRCIAAMLSSILYRHSQNLPDHELWYLLVRGSVQHLVHIVLRILRSGKGQHTAFGTHCSAYTSFCVHFRKKILGREQLPCIAYRKGAFTICAFHGLK